MTKVRIGIVGTGGMAKIHTTAYMKNDNCQVTSICGINMQDAQQFASGNWGNVAYSEGALEIKALYDIENTFDDYKKMAESDDIDAVSIVVPNVLHFDMAMAFIKNKKHVLVEKPLCIDVKSAKALVDEARKQNVMLATGHMWRYHKEVDYLKELIEQGMLGDIVQTKSYSCHLRWGPDGWFSKKAEAGGGGLIDMGIHAIDTTRYLIGDPEPSTLYASVGTKFGDYDVDDFAQIMVKHKNGIVSLFESGWNFPHISGVEASTEIWGTKGYARLFPTSVQMKVNGVWGEFKPTEVESHTSTNPYNRQVDDFVDSIIKNHDCLVGYEVGLDNLLICEKAYDSAKNDELIRF
jgi:predicted dehydrogenase